MRKFVAGLMMMASMAFGSAVVVAPQAAQASSSVLVGQCVEFGPCWYGPYVPWASDITGAQLAALGLGSSLPFTAAQTACCVIRLGDTTITFDTPGGPVSQTLGEFSGGGHGDPCNYCEIDTVGFFLIPIDATGAHISGVFGNSLSSSTAGVDLFLGPAGQVPEPAVWAMMIAGFGLAGASLRRRRLAPIA